ncbi:MAG TPA: DUF309 domain-containing protein [Candidatus Dormibacteraeota bacterium]|nr:DUF309 domain-containing protein [Candidatus Dormibacteraeota bacterium]
MITKATEFDNGKFRQGIILFNSGEFFKAHEVWEELWLVSARSDKLFLQGMIQLAAAFHHYSRDNRNGTKSLLEAGLKKLEQFPDEFRGVDLNALRGSANNWLAALAKAGAATSDTPPRIE